MARPQDSSAGWVEWLQARQAEQAAIDAAVAGALRRSGGRPGKRERNIRMAHDYLARKQRSLSPSRLKELIGKEEELGRRAAIDAIDDGLEIIKQKTVR